MSYLFESVISHLAWIPGCGTLSEIHTAEELGCDIIKIFPANDIGGPSFVKSVLAPSPWTSLMPSGGVDITEENLKEWFSAGVACVGMGSKLVSNKLIEQHDFSSITENVKKTLNLISKIRN